MPYFHLGVEVGEEGKYAKKREKGWGEWRRTGGVGEEEEEEEEKGVCLCKRERKRERERGVLGRRVMGIESVMEVWTCIGFKKPK